MAEPHHQYDMSEADIKPQELRRGSEELEVKKNDAGDDV